MKPFYFLGRIGSSILWAMSDAGMGLMESIFPSLKPPPLKKIVKKKKTTVLAKPPPVSEGAVPPQFICWFCHEHSTIPPGYDFGKHHFYCGHCQTDNEIDITPLLDTNNVYQGGMIVVNRCAQFFEGG